MGFSRLVRFDGIAAVLVCKSERDQERVSGGEPERGLVESGRGSENFPRLPTLAPLGSLDTLPRSRSRKMAASPLKPTSVENRKEK